MRAGAATRFGLRAAGHGVRGRVRPLLLITLGLLLAAVAVAEWAAWPFLRAPVERTLARSLDRAVLVAPPFGVRFFGSLRMHAGGLAIGPARTDSPSLLDAEGRPLDLVRAAKVRLGVPWRTVWQHVGGTPGPPTITLLDVVELEANLARDAQGRANWKLWRPAAAPPDAAASAALDLPRFESLVVQRGRVRLDDRPQALKLDVTLSTREGESATAAASAASVATGLDLQASGSWRGAPLKATLASSGALPIARSDSRDGPLGAVPLKFDLRLGRTHLQIDGSGTDLMHLRELQGKFRLDGPSLAAVGDVLGLTLPTTAAFMMHGSVRKSGAIWAAGVERLEIGSSRLRGDFHYDTSPKIPLLSGTLAGSRLALNDLGPVIGAPAPGAPASAAADGRALPQRAFDVPSLRAMNADVQLQLEQLDLGTPKLEPFAPLRGRITLQDGILGVRDLLARGADGELRGAISVDARTAATPRWDADLQVTGIDLARFLRAPNPRSRKAAQRDSGASTQAAAGAVQRRSASEGYVSGRLGGAARGKGQGRSIAAVLGSMNGTIQFWVRQGELSHLVIEAAGIDVAESLGLMVVGDKPLPMRCAVAQFAVREGRALVEVAVVDTGDTTLQLGGELSFDDEKLALVLTASPHDFSLLSLRAPVRVQGTLSQPAVKLDKRNIALRLGGAAVLGSVVPLAALLPLIDLGESDRQVCETALARLRTQAAPKPAGARSAAPGAISPARPR